MPFLLTISRPAQRDGVCYNKPGSRSATVFVTISRARGALGCRLAGRGDVAVKGRLLYSKVYLTLAVLAVFCAGCGVREMEVGNKGKQGEPLPAESPAISHGRKEKDKEQEDYYQDYQEKGGKVALVGDVGSHAEDSYNQAALEGVRSYAQAAGISYSYYSAGRDSREAYEEAVLYAIENQAEVVVCAGPHFEQAVGTLQEKYGEVNFLLLDGVPRDKEGEGIPIAPNVHCIAYHEEEAGYLAGYMAVLEGCRKLGFIGGERLPSVERYGFGYLKGIDDAAASLGITGQVSVEYWYGGSFLPSKEIEKTARKWYQDGTEIIFACGGSLYQSVLKAAEKTGGLLIGADVDQSGVSGLFLTSAMKGIQSSVIFALDELFAGGGSWPDGMAGQVMDYSAEKNCIKLPMAEGAWRFQKVSMKEYFQVLVDLNTGKIPILGEGEGMPETEITVIFYNEGREKAGEPEETQKSGKE
ncbi:membrane lipoprotein TmpC [Lachnospiraceae bacterium]|nr:membrane lipoprotein TmpC [Lachnospiraceae bacterium]